MKFGWDYVMQILGAVGLVCAFWYGVYGLLWLLGKADDRLKARADAKREATREAFKARNGYYPEQEYSINRRDNPPSD